MVPAAVVMEDLLEAGVMETTVVGTVPKVGIVEAVGAEVKAAAAEIAINAVERTDIDLDPEPVAPKVVVDSREAVVMEAAVPRLWIAVTLFLFPDCPNMPMNNSSMMSSALKGISP